MWLAAITPAFTAVASALLNRRTLGGGHLSGALLSRTYQPAVFGLFCVMASLDCTLYLNDELYQRCMSGLDHLGLLAHPATLLGQRQDISLMCTASSSTILADSAGKVQCLGDGNCGFYSILNGMNLNANKVRVLNFDQKFKYSKRSTVFECSYEIVPRMYDLLLIFSACTRVISFFQSILGSYTTYLSNIEALDTGTLLTRTRTRHVRRTYVLTSTRMI